MVGFLTAITVFAEPKIAGLSLWNSIQHPRRILHAKISLQHLTLTDNK